MTNYIDSDKEKDALKAAFDDGVIGTNDFVMSQIKQAQAAENYRTREVIEKELRDFICARVKELNDKTGMSVKSIDVRLLSTDYGAGKKKEYFLHRIDIEYHS